MAGMSVGGLVSGLDTNSIIAQLTALEQSKVNREIAKKDNAQKTLDTFKELQTRLGNLAVKALSLSTPNSFNLFNATSNYDDFASIAGKEGATAGQYELVVKQLATTQKVASKKIDAVNTPLVAASDINAIFGSNETVTITLSKSAAALKTDHTKESVEIKISKSDTLKDIVNKINAAEGTGVKASIMTMGDGDNRLVLTAVDTGTKGFSISDNGLDNGQASILQYLGILSAGSDQTASSGNALITNKGEVATGESKFTDFNTAFTKINSGDVVGIYLPNDTGTPGGGWITFDLFDSSGSKTVDQVLGEINTALASSGITASINNDGEIVVSGNLKGDVNFKDLGNIKIQIGSLKSGPSVGNPIGVHNNDDIFSEVKKDLGGFSSRSSFENVINEGQNAIYTVDGMSVSSQSNSDDKTISGTVFTLKKVSTAGMEPIKVSLTPNMDGLAGKISEFIEEFNALIKFIDENSKASVKEEEDKVTGKKTSKREVGVFSGDSNISSLRDNLRRMVTGTIDQISGVLDSGYSTNYSSAARLGIITQKDGSLGVDREALVKALNSDFEGVRKLFTANSFSSNSDIKIGNFNKYSTTGIYNVEGLGGGAFKVNGEEIFSSSNILTLANGISIELSDPNAIGDLGKVTFVRGIASMITNFVDNAKSTVDGYFKASEKTYQNRIDTIQKRIDELQIRVDNYSARITRQFSALERSMGNLQSQTANMMAALGGLSR
ncbi:MAG: flagellar filament capping protein FliD [Fibromonadales bacterium]|nr:flagellar filament capping protein FliD [Fibromonadales bacterium]